MNSYIGSLITLFNLIKFYLNNNKNIIKLSNDIKKWKWAFQIISQNRRFPEDLPDGL